MDFQDIFSNFSIISALRAAPSSMVLERVFAKWRAVLFCTKSYFPLVGGTSPIPLTALPAGYAILMNRYFLPLEISSEMKKEGNLQVLNLQIPHKELSSDIVFSDTFLFLFFVAFKELVDIVFCSLNLLHIFLNLTIFTVQLFLFCKDLGILGT